MNPLDIALLLVLAAFCVYGAVKGIVKLLLGGFAVAFGFFLGCWYNAPVAAWLEGWIESEAGRRLAALALVFAGTLLAFGLLVWFITKTLEAVKLRWVDRVGGAALGAAIAALLLAAAIVPLVAFLPSDSALVEDSTLSPWVMKISAFVKGVIPVEIRKRYEEAGEKMKAAGKDLFKGSGAPPPAKPAPGAGTDPNAAAGATPKGDPGATKPPAASAGSPGR